jgi:hypothetical protein
MYFIAPRKSQTPVGQNKRQRQFVEIIGIISHAHRAWAGREILAGGTALFSYSVNV